MPAFNDGPTRALLEPARYQKIESIPAGHLAGLECRGHLVVPVVTTKQPRIVLRKEFDNTDLRHVFTVAVRRGSFVPAPRGIMFVRRRSGGNGLRAGRRKHPRPFDGKSFDCLGIIVNQASDKAGRDPDFGPDPDPQYAPGFIEGPTAIIGRRSRAGCFTTETHPELETLSLKGTLRSSIVGIACGRASGSHNGQQQVGAAKRRLEG